MRVLIVGASAGLGRALAEACADRGHDTILVARDQRDVDALARHLVLTRGVAADAIGWDLGGPDIAPLARRVLAAGTLDGILLPAGAALGDDSGGLPPGRAEWLWRVNFANQLALVTALWPRLIEAPHGVVAGFGSVAAIRGRRRNIVYAAAKRALQSYFESLRHLAVGTRVTVRFFQLGYLDTQQTFGKNLPLPKGSPARLAELVVDTWQQDRGTTVYPAYWRLVGTLVRALPWSVYRKLNF